MATFYSVPVTYLNGSSATANAIGNNAAWLCACGQQLLGPTTFAIPACTCGKRFRVVPVGTPGTQVRVVEEF